MFKQFATLLLFTSLAVANCRCSSLPQPHSHPSVSVLLDETVVLESDEGNAYCSAVWVGPHSVLTAHHCIADEEQDAIHVETSDGEDHLAFVDKDNADADLAMLWVPRQLKHISARVASSLSVGESLDIIGSPNGVKWTYIHGWVEQFKTIDSANTDANVGVTLVQAPVWFGNSGGPAFDSNGELVGICSRLSIRQPTMGIFVGLDDIQSLVSHSL